MTSEQTQLHLKITSAQLTDIALSTIRAAIGSAKYQYLSGPITGGRRLLDWHDAEGRYLAGEERRDARRLAVTLPNIADVQRTAEQERNAGRLTIEPGSFEAELEHWGQPEFYNFWDRVIEDHAAEVRFMPGWELSVGCTFEYLCARKHGRATLDIAGNSLLVETALELLDSALQEIQSRYDPGDPRDAPIAELHAGLTRYRQAINGSPAIANGD